MEVYNPSKVNSAAYAAVFDQSGHGRVSMDRYVYDQSGEGIGAVLGNLLKFAIPLAGPIFSGIKSLIKKEPSSNLRSTAKNIIQSDEFNQFARDAGTYIAKEASKSQRKKPIKAGDKRQLQHISGPVHQHISSPAHKQHKGVKYRKRFRR